MIVLVLGGNTGVLEQWSLNPRHRRPPGVIASTSEAISTGGGDCFVAVLLKMTSREPVFPSFPGVRQAAHMTNPDFSPGVVANRWREGRGCEACDISETRDMTPIDGDVPPKKTWGAALKPD